MIHHGLLIHLQKTRQVVLIDDGEVLGSTLE